MKYEHGQWLSLLETKKNEYVITPLKFKMGDLEPTMSSKTVDIHYNTLTKNYIKKANETGDDYQVAGAFLHNLWWEQLQKSTDNKPEEAMLDFIEKHFKSFSDFKDEFKESATTIEGNGWCALVKSGKCVQIPNHEKRDDIVLLIDMWEHSYFLDHGAKKDKYVDAFWKLVDWVKVEERL